MAWTKWYSPSLVTRIETDQTDFTDGSGLLDRPAGLTAVAPLYGLSNEGLDGRVIPSGSNAVLFSDFGFVGGTVVGVRVRTDIVRLGRVADRTVQLYNSGLIGENRAGELYEQVQEYGGPADLWGVDSAPWDSAEFGVVIDLTAHPRYPSSTVPIIRAVTISFNLE